MPQRIAVAVSGGVDSLCALLLLRQAGHEVLALHGLMHDSGAANPLPGLEAACASLGVPLHVVDLRQAFAERVRHPFARSLCEGQTPNPCAVCNARIKFGALFDAAMDCGCTHLATGHYARLERGPAGPWLGRAADSGKDQGYFLALVPQERLERVIFPLEGRTKDENRATVAAAGLDVPVPRESQDICFLPPGDASELDWAVLAGPSRLSQPPAGPILLRADDGTLREVGRHRGLWRYTLGQRRGLGVAYSEGLYVLEKDCAANSLVVGPRAMLGAGGCVTGRANLFCPPKVWPAQVFARLRYRHKAVPASVAMDEERCLLITFAETQFPPAPGQIAAVYDSDGHLLAGAPVSRVLPSTAIALPVELC